MRILRKRLRRSCQWLYDGKLRVSWFVCKFRCPTCREQLRIAAVGFWSSEHCAHKAKPRQPADTDSVKKKAPMRRALLEASVGGSAPTTLGMC